MNKRQFQTRGTLEFDERPALEECTQDPIHKTASIQAHGTFLQVDPNSGRILSAAENIERFLGERLGEVVGAPISDFFREESGDWFRSNVVSERAGPVRTGIEIDGTPFAASLFPVGDAAGIELERTAEEVESANERLMHAHSLFERIRGPDSQAELAEVAVHAVRDASTFERVMFYEFDKWGHGSVVAEERKDGLDSYLGQKFPASDIPEPARRLYRKNPFRYIPDAAAEPVQIHGPDGPRDRRHLDLTYSDLRGVPHVHRQYLANMGVRGSMSIPLMVDGDLEALIACHMVTASAELSWPRRYIVALLGRFISERFAELQSRLREERREEVASLDEDFPEDIGNFAAFSREIQNRQSAILSLMDANRFYLQFLDHQVSLSEKPSAAPAELLLATIRQQIRNQQTVVVDSIVGDVDDSWNHSGEIAGYLATRLGHSGQAFAVWFRSEQRRSIDWGGDPREPVGVDDRGRLEPRNSFESWTQIVAGQCRPWTDLDRVTAREIRTLLKNLTLETQSHQMHRLNEKLESINDHNQKLLERVNRLARTDDLTGLTNRGEFQRKLEYECERAHRYEIPLSLLLLDLDHFKSINDEYGHQTGDGVLEVLGELLREETRSTDVPARYGGEEFTVLLPQTEMERAGELANRVLESLRSHEFEHDGDVFSVTCSIGVSQLQGDDSEALLGRADRALYRAKEAGRDRLEFGRE